MRIKNIITLIKHRNEVRRLIEALLIRHDKSIEFGSLTQAEADGLVNWIKGAADQSSDPFHVVEIGTLFGSTTRQLSNISNTRLTTVDNFTWNPLGLDPLTHEKFTRHLLRDTRITIIKENSLDFLKREKDIDFVFLDGDHSYDAVRNELLALKENGVKHISGHDWGDERFGVTKAVREILGMPDQIIGRCWYKRN